MTTTDFTTTIMVDQSPAEAFKAIVNLRGWWSAGIEGVTDKLNDEFIYHYQDVHYCKMKLVELMPDQKVVWLVLDNYFKFTNDKTEWIDTKLVFDVSLQGNQTAITFTHKGLTPEYECYEICNEAWTNYIKHSLYNLITTGTGQPNRKEDDAFDARLVEKWRQQQNIV
ncbi:MAG: SRPBCC domain-containing protein [Mucilaginibacter sp.]